MKWQLLWVDKNLDSIAVVERSDEPNKLMDLAEYLVKRNHRRCIMEKTFNQVKVITDPDLCLEPMMPKVEGFYSVLPA